MVNLDLPLIATALGIIGVLWKLSSSINQFSTSVEQLKKSVEESQTDRKDIRNTLVLHDKEINTIKTHYGYIREDLDEIKEKIDKKVG